MQDTFVVQGLEGRPLLSGSISVAGAKNAVLKAMAASLLLDDSMVFTNVPRIEDVERMKELLIDLGADVVADDKKLTITSPKKTSGELAAATGKMRSSIVLTGPILARYGKVTLSHPGGCVIGPRPIDQFTRAYKKMGAVVEESEHGYTITTDGLQGADIFFTVVSVTATETIMMAATLATGVTRIKNAAMEPEIVQLAEFLNACGANIRGAGTPFIEIEGVSQLAARGAVYNTIPDRIETGSFLILGALAASELTITNCIPEHVAVLLELLRDAGVDIEVFDQKIVVRGGGTYQAVNVRTHEYPGFATDLQAPMTVFLTQAKGESRLFESIFEGRLSFTEDLVLMGADITQWNQHEIVVKGPRALRGRTLEAPDLRAGLAFIIATAIASGESVIKNAYYIDRGYEQIDERLVRLGLSIKRVTQES